MDEGLNLYMNTYLNLDGGRPLCQNRTRDVAAQHLGLVRVVDEPVDQTPDAPTP